MKHDISPSFILYLSIYIYIYIYKIFVSKIIEDTSCFSVKKSFYHFSNRIGLISIFTALPALIKNLLHIFHLGLIGFGYIYFF
jgi:hypothetical protein